MPSVVVRCRDVAVVKGLGCRGAWKVGDGFLGAGGREVGVGSKKILIPKVPPIDEPRNPYFSRFQRRLNLRASYILPRG